MQGTQKSKRRENETFRGGAEAQDCASCVCLLPTPLAWSLQTEENNDTSRPLLPRLIFPFRILMLHQISTTIVVPRLSVLDSQSCSCLSRGDDFEPSPALPDVSKIRDRLSIDPRICLKYWNLIT